MTFSYVDLNLISDEEYKHLLSINRWIIKDELTQVYVVKDNNDIKSVFCLNQNGYYYTKAKLCYGTKEKERGKGYCSFGLYMLLEVIETNPSLEEALIVSINKITDILCQKLEIPTICDNILYLVKNPNFNSKYKELELLVKKGTPFEELMDFCGNDETMLQILNIWLDKRNKGFKLKYK